MGLKTFTNTRYLSDAANDYTKNKGVYTQAPIGSRDYEDYWAEQTRRCKEGYSVGDVSITGRHYFYLNFCPIEQADSTANKNTIASKILTFPKFWEIDYNWWWAKDIAMNGASAEKVKSLQIDGLPIKDYNVARHLSCLKTRRAGFSYKEAADGVYNYNFIPRSKSYYFASRLDYLVVDGILNKAATHLDHLNNNTQTYWLKNRMEKNTTIHYKASYIDDRGIVRGYKSEIIGVPIDNANKVRGKSGLKITFEEAGSFRGLREALAIAVPSVRSGTKLTGQISVFGTGGEEGPDIEGLEDIFAEPDAYDMLAFNNIWEEGMEDTLCGYFVPCYSANEDFMDENGNCDIPNAIKYDETERDKKRKLRNIKELDKRVAEFPRTPSEALQRVSQNILPVVLAQEQLRKIERNPDIQSSMLHGIIFQGEKKIEFRPSNAVHPIEQFPHKNDDDLTGCVTIFYPPDPNAEYFSVTDPYYRDQAEDRTSLWAFYIMKRKSMGDVLGDVIVAKYVGRPTLLNTCYENSTLLAKMYKCKIQCEIAGGGEGFYTYLKNKKLIDMAEFQPTLFNKKQVQQLKNRQYFMNISTEDKKNGLSYFAEWLIRPRGLNIHGQPVLNIHMITDAGLLREIIKYNPDPKKNFDRISAMIVAMFMMKEEEIKPVNNGVSKYNSFIANSLKGVTVGYNKSISL